MKTLAMTFLALMATAVALAAEATSREPQVVIPRVRELAPPPTVASMKAILGKHDEDIGSGIHVFFYLLTDQSWLLVSSVDGKKVAWISHLKTDGTSESLFRSD